MTELKITKEDFTNRLKLLSIVIPAKNEEECILPTLEHLHLELNLNQICHEIIVVDDSSSDKTYDLVKVLSEKIPGIHIYRSELAGGFGNAIVYGLNKIRGDAVVVMMADESDDPRDVIRYWNELNKGYDCVFGSRFIKGGGVIDYPILKLVMNRIFNKFLQLIFRIKLNDVTNAFKAYRVEVISGCHPIIAKQFNLTVELPLKAIIRGYTWSTVPITWRNRRAGVAKLKIKEMGSRYLFIVLYCWLEKYLSRGDYLKK